MRRYRRRGGFTLLELVVVLGVGLVLIVTLVPYLMALREGSRRVACADGLRQALGGFVAYRASNDNVYPRTIFEPAAEGPAGWTAFTGAGDDRPFEPGAGEQVAANDVTASLWLLVRGGFVPETGVFVCPSSGDEPDPLRKVVSGQARRVGPRERGNFAGPNHLSYGYADPFSAVEGYSLNDDLLPPEFAVLADAGPAPTDPAGAFPVAADARPIELAAGNSPHHNRAGQNVLYADGGVRWRTSPYVGVGLDDGGVPDGDNIYTALRPAPLAAGDDVPPDAPGVVGRAVGPSYPYDSYLVPWAE